MHALAVQLAPVLAAEKSKTPFYIAGGILVAWALLLSLGIGLNRPDFPSSVRAQRTVMAISAVLVLITVTAAVVTASPPSNEASAASTTTSSAAGSESPPSPESSTPAKSEGGEASTTATSTTGTGASTTSTAAAPSAGAGSVSLSASTAGLLAYNTKTLSAKAGSVTINFANASPLEHNVTIAQGSTVLGATPTFSGGARQLTLKLKPGKYTFYCSVPGHRQAGMEGTLNVS